MTGKGQARTGVIVDGEEGIEAGTPYVFAMSMSNEALLVGLEEVRLLRSARNDRYGRSRAMTYKETAETFSINPQIPQSWGTFIKAGGHPQTPARGKSL